MLMIGQLLQALLAQMKMLVPPQEIVRRVTLAGRQAQQGQGHGSGNSTGSQFAEFKDVLQSMIAAYSHDGLVMQAARRMHVQDLHELHGKQIWQKVMIYLPIFFPLVLIFFFK